MSLSIEKAAELGIHLVHEAEGLVRFERVGAAGTQKFEGKDLDGALAVVEAHLAQHPGAAGTDISRSDGASESLDETQKHSAQVGPSDLPTPAADAAAAAPAPAVDSTVASEVVDVAAAPAPVEGDEPAAPEVES